MQRNSSSLGKGQRRNLSSMTKVLSLILAAAQHLNSSCTDCWNRAVRFGRSSGSTEVLSMIFAAAQFLDSSCADCWNRAVRFGRPDLLEICANSDSPLVDAVETSFLLEWIRFDFQARTRTSLRVLFSEESETRMVFVTFSSLWSIITACVRILQRIADVFPRVQALGCHVHFSQPLSSASWNQKFLLDMTEKNVEGSCQWLRVGFA